MNRSDSSRPSPATGAADPDTLRRRFLGGPPHLTPAVLVRLTTLDYLRRFALAAADQQTGQAVAIAHYESAGDGSAEVAVAVDRAWRRVGPATALVELLAQAALERGIHEFTATYLATNRPVAALALTGGAGTQLIRQGIAELAVALDQQQVAAAVHMLQEPESGRAVTRRSPSG